MKIGTVVRIIETGEKGSVVEVRKYIGPPYAVRLESGRLYWCGPADVRREQ